MSAIIKYLTSPLLIRAYSLEISVFNVTEGMSFMRRPWHAWPPEFDRGIDSTECLMIPILAHTEQSRRNADLSYHWWNEWSQLGAGVTV